MRNIALPGTSVGHGNSSTVIGAWGARIILVLVAAVGADWLAPHPSELHTDVAGQGPSWHYPFGVSRIGHDQLASLGRELTDTVARVAGAEERWLTLAGEAEAGGLTV